MRGIILIAAMLLSQSVFALTQCGDSKNDRRHGNLDWIKATNYRADSSFITLRGILCAGIDRNTNTLKRIHYRDDSGVVVLTTKAQLKRSDVTFLRRSDFPRVARMVTRNVDPLTIKIISERIKLKYTEYNLSLKFVRNMGKGFSKTDIRNLKINARMYKNGKFDVYYGSTPTVRNTFDLVALRIGGDLKVSTVNFYDGQSSLGGVPTAKLPKTTRR